ncbi:hypothetical protein [Novosphingobium mangrovi (ex Huang et al. 2023)]|uniref:Lipoprotein n=1 Tax=Novosphingobium mangrovi (ex Huang et al. 2023) TaxID=2976432 RepID=A0ABT2I098_9SPHN|nr:hypothetical protein [Novosphingobium mangrovi (ex Huang et al. 2023)]MCT2398227.1 hypothetical protein [Novosphingobium mangrovi (ex Huang et al. 2023)]
MKRQAYIAAPLATALLLSGALAGCKKDEPQGEPSAAPSEDVTLQSTRSWIRANYEDMGKLLYAEAETDLDGDGTPEVLAYVGGPMMCGTGGCNLVVLRRDGAQLRKVSELSVVQLPVGVLESKSNGWHDLAVTIAGGGVVAHTVRLAFDGKGYPENPTVSPAEETDSIGTELIPLEPLRPVE